MRAPTYIAELSALDYPRFCQRDPSLPETYAAWAKAISQQVRTLRARGVDVVLYPITFDDFEMTMNTLHTGSFDASTRNRYAADMAANDRSRSRL